MNFVVYPGNTDLQFSGVAMALSGYTGSGSPTLWLDTCRRLQNELKSAYLQMAFAFLIACAEENKSNENESLKFEPILSNKVSQRGPTSFHRGPKSENFLSCGPMFLN